MDSKSLTYLVSNSLKSYSKVLTFHFVTFGSTNVICRFKITFDYYLSMLFYPNHRY
ncbi:hypothetical protein Hanom_Chr14g01254361 [Helianthus anomalus]